MRENRTDNCGKAVFAIKPLAANEIETVLRIESSCGLTGSKTSDFERGLNDANKIIEVALLEKRIVGFVEARLITPVLEIINIAVLKEFRRCKIGGALLRKTFEIAARERLEEVWLEVRESNEAAIRFYTAHNFRVAGRRKNYYTAPSEDALLMNLKFSDLSK